MALPLILAGAGLAAQALSPLFSKKVTPKNINQEQTEQFTALLEQMLSDSESSLTAALRDAGFTQEQISSLASKQGQLASDIGNLEVPSAGDWFDQFTQEFVPAYQTIAEQTATAGVRTDAAQERADRLSSEAVTAALDKYAGGGAYGGAAVEAATQAAITPQLEYLQSVDQLFSSLYGSTFNQLANTGQQLSFQGTQNEFLNNLQKLQGQISALGQQGQSLGQVLQGQLGQAQVAQGQQGSALGQLGQLSQSVYSTPSYVESPLGGIGQALVAFSSLLSGAQTQNTNQGLLNQLNNYSGTTPQYSSSQLLRAQQGLGGL